MNRALVFGGLLVVLGLAGVASIAAKPASDTPRYDTNREYTIRGTVIETRTHMSTQGLEDMHVTLDTGRGVFEVHLAPVAFLTERGVLPAKGDEVVVTGSMTHWQGAEVVVAREITRAGHAVAVRDLDGIPLWPKKLHA